MIYLRYIFNALALVVLTGVYSVIAALALPFRATSAVARMWARKVVKVCGVDVVASGWEQALNEPAYVVLANHTSHFDVISLYSTMPIDVRPVAKRELGYIPVFGWVLVAGAAIMIDRGDRSKAIGSIERAGRAIRGGRSVLMFPEGTRTPPGELGAMKKGPFHLALAARVPILPIGVSGTGAVLPKGDWRIRPGPVRICVGTPIPTADLPEDEPARAALAERVAAALRLLMDQGAQDLDRTGRAP